MSTNRKGMASKSQEEKAVKFKGVVISPKPSEHEIIWATIVFNLKGGGTEMMFGVYSSHSHDHTLDSYIDKEGINPKKIMSIEINKLKSLGKTLVLNQSPIVKWKLKEE